MTVYSLESAIVDIVLDVPYIPKSGTDVIGGNFRQTPGGGIYSLLASRRCGAASTYVGCYGNGPYGRLIQELFSKEDICVLLPPSETKDTGFCIALVEPNSERTFITYPGVEAEITRDLLSVPEYSSQDYLIVSGYDLAYTTSQKPIAEFIKTMQTGVLVFDPGPLVDQIPLEIIEQVLERTKILSLNEREFALLGGDLPALLLRLCSEAVIILRSGSKGATYVSKSEQFHIDAPQVEALDSTGAGDIHLGALIGMRAQNQPWPASLHLANVAAALSVMRTGSTKMPNLQEILNSPFLQTEGYPTLGTLSS